MTVRPWPRHVDGVLLREAAEEDLDRVVELRNDPRGHRWLVRTHVDPTTLRDQWRGLPQSTTDFSCVAEVDGQVAALGFLELVDGSGQPGVPALDEALIGYLVDPAHQGRGVATALARGLVDAAFDTLGARRVTAACYAENPASARVLEKAGLRREARRVQDCWHAELGWTDSLCFALLRSEREG